VLNCALAPGPFVAPGFPVPAKTDAVPESSSHQYRATITDADGEAIAQAQVSQVLMTLRDVKSDDIVNSRDAVDVLGSELTIPTAGDLRLQFAAEDMPAIGTAEYQQRRLTLDFRLVGGGRFTHAVLFYVQNLTDITA